MSNAWESKKLGTLCEIRTGRKDVNQGNPGGKYPFFTCAKDHTYSDEYSFDCEALLIAGNGDVGNVSHYAGKFEAYQRTYVLMGFDEVLPRYLFLVLQGTLKKVLVGQKLGNTMPYIKKGMLSDFPVPLPPLPEQIRIVAILDEAFAGIDQAIVNTERNIENARELFSNTRDSYFSSPPDHWESHRLGELCERVEYGSSAKSKSTGLVPVVRMGNIQKGTIDWADLVYSDDQEEISKYLLQESDVLFNRTNSAALVGKTAIYRGERPAIFAGYLIRIHRKSDQLDARFLNHYLNSGAARVYGEVVMSKSVNQANINGTKLKNYPIHVPSLAEQKRVSDQLDQLLVRTNELETAFTAKVSCLLNLRESVLTKAFKGTLSRSEQTLGAVSA